jgi:hypothetical protein
MGARGPCCASMSGVEASNLPARARARWAGMGGKLGLGCCALGFLLVVIAWNGAAGLDYVQGQVPYLISGGVGGLGLVVLGSALLVVEGNRRDRAMLERKLDEVLVALRAADGQAGAPRYVSRSLDESRISSPTPS